MATDQQLTELLEHCVGFAKQMIEKAGEFYPFGAAICPLGSLQALAFWNGEERPLGADLYRFAQDSMRTKTKDEAILAGAIAADVNIPPNYEAPFPDGIRIHIEGDGYARLIYLPYSISKTGFLRKKQVDYGEMFAVEIEPAFFARPIAN